MPVEEAPAAFGAVRAALRDRGAATLAVDVPTGHAVMSAALTGLDARLVSTQMLLDLTRPVPAPARVALRPMTADEFAGYREHLVTAYAQDMVDAGAFDDLPTALTASERSTQELLPDGPASPGHHLWSAMDGDAVVGILWIHSEGAKAFIYDIEVRDELRRRGYGQEMLDAGASGGRRARGADARAQRVRAQRRRRARCMRARATTPPSSPTPSRWVRRSRTEPSAPDPG